jgi:hypothetical protein
VFAGGAAPMTATALLAATGSGYVISLYIFSGAIASILATGSLPSTRDLEPELPARLASAEARRFVQRQKG